MQGASLDRNIAAANAGPPSGRPAGRPDLVDAGGVLGRLGTLEVRLARDEREVAAAQRVRYDVFYAELGARMPENATTDRRDADRFDALCDHLLVFDTAIAGPAERQIVGTYRLLRQEKAEAAGGFYSDEEFGLEALIARHPGRRFLELGRSCVVREYRTKRTVELLWQCIWAYCRRYAIDVMTGCASFPGTVPAAHAEALSFLAHFCRAEGAWAVSALPHRFRSMDLMPAEAVRPRAAVSAMPPLVKGYLRLGARFGEGCVVDRDFGTTDVFVVLPIDAIAERYLNYYGGETQRFAVNRA